MFIKILITTLLIINSCSALSAQEVSNQCHCDLTTGFCDMECCCDTDCSSTIDASCFLKLSSIFCINSSYYFKVDSSLTPSQTLTDCYYYNETNALQEQVNISATQLNRITSAQNSDLSPLTNISTYKGYKLGQTMAIDGIQQFTFRDSSGNCVNSATITQKININYRMNLDFVCLATDNNINLYTNIFGKSIPIFKDFAQTITIPQLPSESFNQVIVYIFIGTYGSSKIQYIQNIQVKVKSNSHSNTRTLRWRFVDPLVDLPQEQESPSFFPQIPYDIFYPIQQIVYSF